MLKAHAPWLTCQGRGGMRVVVASLMVKGDAPQAGPPSTAAPGSGGDGDGGSGSGSGGSSGSSGAVASSGMSAAAKAGIALGVVAGLVAAAAGGVVLWPVVQVWPRRRRGAGVTTGTAG